MKLCSSVDSQDRTIRTIHISSLRVMLIILLLFFIFFIVFFLFLYLVDVNIIDSNYIQQLLQFFCVSYSFVSKVSGMRNVVKSSRLRTGTTKQETLENPRIKQRTLNFLGGDLRDKAVKDLKIIVSTVQFSLVQFLGDPSFD